MKTARKSLRSILTLWFLAFTIIPLAFISGYSTVLYESSLNTELQKRLDGNVREVGVTLGDLENMLLTSGKIHGADPTLVYHVATRNIPAARRVVSEWMKTYSASRIRVFDREGRLIVAQMKAPTGEIKTQSNLETGDVFLADNLLRDVNGRGQTSVHEVHQGSGLEIIVYTRILQKESRTAGYLEEIIELGQGFLGGLKKRLNLEAIIFDEKNDPVLSTRDDFLLYPKEFFPEKIGEGKSFFDLTSREEPFGMVVKKIVDTRGHYYVTLGLAASKRDSQRVLQRIKATLLTMTFVILLFLVPILIYVSIRVVKPINLLVDATEKLEKGQLGFRLGHRSETEIGILVDSFNRMAQNIAATQASLVQSAKMASLGQLVAGVAHELNNPIGFIYSNMAHLRDYAERLFKIIKTAEKNPKDIEKVKADVEYDYIVEDLPKLITSCEDGARRTRDIVIGLRNFSRLDEAQLKRVDIHEGLRNTLKLLSGELKNRIRVHEKFDVIPEVRCYPSQLNQVFMNVISNAAQAIAGEGEIRITTRHEAPWAVISIKDNGPGIAQVDLDKIFDPFFTTKPVGRGTGLGLSISYGIVQKHGGDISVKSKKGEGTEFVVRVPVDGPSDTKTRVTETQAPPPN